ncbi:MAG TPA: hypothetical protein ENK72_02115 [Epsilonproteobacteria bacterium]|nr:hypothetical protein [Campylobacterota bacterium]
MDSSSELDQREAGRYIACLTACCQVVSSEEKVTKNLQGLELERLVAVAQQHAVFPLLYQNLQKYERSLTLPELFKQKLQQLYLGIVQYNMLLSSELHRIVARCQASGLTLVSFKGPVLASLAYGGISLRQYGDIDLLIDPKELQSVTRILSSEGYQAELEMDEEELEHYSHSTNVLGFYHATYGIRVEIHWQLTGRNYVVDWSAVDPLGSRETVTLQEGNGLSTLSREIHFVYLCVHGAKHLFERLLWVADIDRMARGFKDNRWQEVWKTAKILGVERMVCFALLLTNKLLHTPYPQWVMERIVSGEIEASVEKVIRYRFAKEIELSGFAQFRLLLSLYGIRKKAAFIYHAWFSVNNVDINYYKLPKSLGFLYLLLRPVRLVNKHLLRRGNP